MSISSKQLNIPAFSPIGLHERSEWLDALRGFALLGILLANIMTFSGHTYLDPQTQAQLPWSGADHLLSYLEHVLVEAKFYSLFSFLFGLGFAVQLRRAEARGGDFTSVHRRRMAWLLGFGLSHALLIWFGDILVFYALMGCALLLFRTLSDRALLTWALIFLTMPIWLYAGYLGFLQMTHAAPITPPSLKGVRSIFDGFASGGYTDMLASNAQVYAVSWVRRIYRFQLLRIFGMFLLGAWAGRVGLPLARDALRPMLKRWLVLGLAIGLPMNLAVVAIGINAGNVMALASAKALLSVALDSFGIPLLSLAYAAAFGLYWCKDRGNGNVFVASGRMALTHYLSQSVVCIAVFYGIGAGLFGRISVGMSLLFALAIYLSLSLLCRLWLKHYPQGPMEALWRRLSYGRAALVRMIHTDFHQ